MLDKYQCIENWYTVLSCLFLPLFVTIIVVNIMYVLRKRVFIKQKKVILNSDIDVYV